MKVFFTVILSFLLFMTTAEAAKIDVYRDLLSSGRFTLKYTMTSPPIRVTNKEATITGVNMFNSLFEDFEMTNSSFAQSSSLNDYKGIIVFNGENKYFQNGATSILKKNGENFRFLYFQEGNKKTYYGNYGSKGVYANFEEQAGKMNAIDVLHEDYSYGTLTTALAPIILPNRVIATPYMPEYKFIGSGTLDNGLSYEDFFGSKNGFNCAIRYYFDGDTLSKIAVFDYITKNSRVQTYEKYLVQIDEFSSTPDQSYLMLPTQLKDKTKRNKGAKK